MLLLVFMALAAVPIFNRLSLPPLPKQALKIAYILPLSGDWAFLGQGIKSAVEQALAKRQRNAFKVEILFEDSQGDIATAVTAARRAIDQEKVNSIVSVISGVAGAIKPIATANKVIAIGICSDPVVADGQYAFLNYITAEQAVRAYLEAFASHYPPGSVPGIFAVNEAGFQRIVQEYRKQSPIKPAFIENFNSGTRDFRSMILKRKKSKVPAVLILGLSPELEILVKQIREQKWKVELTSIESFGLVPNKNFLAGSWYIDSAANWDQLQERYVDDKSAYTAGAAQAVDSMNLLIEAYENSTLAGATFTQEALALAFRKISEFPGVSGPLNVPENGIIASAVEERQIQSNSWIVQVPSK